MTGVQLLMAPIVDTDGGTGESGMVAKGSNTAALGIVQKLEIKDGALTGIEPAQDVSPATLVLVAMGKEDVGVLQRVGLALGQLLEADDVGLLGGLAPLANGDHMTSDPEKKEEEEPK